MWFKVNNFRLNADQTKNVLFSLRSYEQPSISVVQFLDLYGKSKLHWNFYIDLILLDYLE